MSHAIVKVKIDERKPEIFASAAISLPTYKSRKIVYQKILEGKMIQYGLVNVRYDETFKKMNYNKVHLQKISDLPNIF